MKKVFYPAAIVGLLGCGESGNLKDTSAKNVQADTASCRTTVKSERVLDDSALTAAFVEMNDKSIAEKINRHIAAAYITGYSFEDLKEQKEKFKTDSIPFGLTDLSYEVNYNQDCLLSLTFNVGTCAAYPSYYSTYRNFDLNTGDSVALEKMLTTEGMAQLINYCDSVIQARIDSVKHTKDCDDVVSEQLEGKRFTKEDLPNYFVTKEHVVFSFVFGFPHVLLAAEPDGIIRVPRSQFRKYLKENPYKL
jgi:hypothetical protein